MSTPKSERRRGERIPVRLGMSIKSGQSQPSTVYTRDLSTSGIFFYSDSEILVGSELEMVLMLPEQLTNGEKRWVCCQAAVLRVEQVTDGGGFGIAASIRSISALPEITG
jgi:hypothetical protein